MPELPPDDPITTQSYSFSLLIASFLLVLSLAWALYDEVYGLRPWRSYQGRFRAAYAKFLQREILEQRAAEEAIYETVAYKKLKGEAQAAQRAVESRDEQLKKEIDYADRRRAALTDVYQTARGKVTALVYQYEIIPATDRAEKASKLKAVEEAKRETWQVELPTLDGKTEKKKLTYDELNQEFTGLLDRKARLVAERADADRQAKELAQERDTHVKEKLVGLSSTQVEGLLRAVETMRIEIRQINVNPPGTELNFLGGVGLVDRCQSCHVAMVPKLVPPMLTVTKASLGLKKSTDAPFTSHPDPELLQIHDPERFGCSPCHGGNGRALDRVTRAHGRYEHWLWPLYYRENFEAGCQQCHAADMVTEHAPVLTRGKEQFRLRGCIGCHRFAGFDDQGEQLLNTRQLIRQLEQQKKDNELEIPRLIQAGDQAPDNAAAQRLYAQADNLRVTNSNLDARMEQLERKSHSLLQEEKKVGPSLKEVRMKLRKEWIPYWLEHTHEFRPTTKMPQFRLQNEEIQAIAAFIWQSGLSGPALEKQVSGSPARGKQLFETRGCLACHSIGEGPNRIGADFAANLSRVGEKQGYDYLVRWIHNPRQRTRPYCPYEKRDLGPEDYAKHRLPFVFDLDHSRCPNDGHELVVQQPTVMPSLRLTWEEARDIASYLITQKHPNASYPSAGYMDDSKLKERGRLLVKNYGCAGCHEIATLEEEGRIGTELTNEGSKPVERLDFALLTEAAKRGILPDGKTKSPRGPWYDQKGFFEQKLTNPAIYDQGKFKPNPLDRLRMPKPNLTPEDITALTTFLLGSVDPQLPKDYIYRPADARRDIQEGWWVVTKYNCMGCHEIQVGQRSILQGLLQYQGENKVNLPPPLIGEGARVTPDWLKQFLANPALSATELSRNGLRSYLQVRMPTFFFSEEETRKLVRFFAALSSQAEPYLPPRLEPLTAAERLTARQLFTSPAAPCLKCHATGNAAHDRNATAPNFLLAPGRLRPAWTKRWILDPAQIAPGTAMPSGLFRLQGGRWVFAGPLPPSLRTYPKDHADLLVRYMFALTPEEQRLLIGRTPAPGTAAPTGR